jgi:hypothetical protein
MLPRGLDLDFYEELYFVYLLVHARHPRFKIGVSSDPVQRARQLVEPFDFYPSRQFGFSKSKAYRVESFLHRQLVSFNIDADIIGFSSGQTEWFDICCFHDCKLMAHLEDWIVPVSSICSRPWIMAKRMDLWARGITGIDGLPLTPLRRATDEQPKCN